MFQHIDYMWGLGCCFLLSRADSDRRVHTAHEVIQKYIFNIPLSKPLWKGNIFAIMPGGSAMAEGKRDGRKGRTEEGPLTVLCSSSSSSEGQFHFGQSWHGPTEKGLKQSLGCPQSVAALGRA